MTYAHPLLCSRAEKAARGLLLMWWQAVLPDALSEANLALNR